MSEEKKALAEILSEMSEMTDARPMLSSEAPPFSLPMSRDHKPTIEVAPGVLVSQHLIDEAVGMSGPDPVSDGEQRTALSNRVLSEIRDDIKASQTLVQTMVERLRDPAKFDEKYVSYDQMPKPLQRVVAAYIAVNEANKELEEAIKALGALAPAKAA